MLEEMKTDKRQTRQLTTRDTKAEYS